MPCLSLLAVLQTKILVDEEFDAVAVIIRDNRQRLKCGRLKAIDGALTGFAMLPLVGDLDELLARLAVYVIEIGELTQVPEALAGISDGALP